MFPFAPFVLVIMGPMLVSRASVSGFRCAQFLTDTFVIMGPVLVLRACVFGFRCAQFVTDTFVVINVEGNFCSVVKQPTWPASDAGG